MNCTKSVLLAGVIVLGTAAPILADCGCGPGVRPQRVDSGATRKSSMSGLGIGLAGIGLSWVAMWIGFRMTGSWRRK